MLLNFLRWIRANYNVKFSILLREGGELETEFAAIAPTWLCNGSRVFRLPKLMRKVLRKFRRWLPGTELSKSDRLLEKISHSKFDLIYSNTITNGLVLKWLSSLEIPALTHVHEMSHWIERSGSENLAAVKEFSTSYVAASNAVKEELEEKWGISNRKVKVVHSFIPTGVKKRSLKEKLETRTSLGVSEGTFLVVGSGVETWRKGKDIFIDLAKELCSRMSSLDFRFLWVGAWESTDHEKELKQRLIADGLENIVIFLGQVQNPLDYFAIADVFAMTSREDPYPLVCLEAALMEVPVLCFSRAGGIPEFVENDAGLIIEHLNVNAMASGICRLIDCPEWRRELGRNARIKVKLNHDIATGSSQLFQLVREACTQR